MSRHHAITLKEGQIMKKRILPILVTFVLWAPGIICTQNAMGGEVIRTTSTNEVSDAYFDEFV